MIVYQKKNIKGSTKIDSWKQKEREGEKKGDNQERKQGVKKYWKIKDHVQKKNMEIGTKKLLKTNGEKKKEESNKKKRKKLKSPQK